MSLDWYDDDTSQKVSEEDIIDVEQKLGVKFPNRYIEMLKVHSGDFSEQLEEMMSINELTTMDNMGEYYCLSFMTEKQLKKVIPIFVTLSGNFYALDYTVLNNHGEPTVIDIDHEADEGVAEDLPRYDSFEAFINAF